MDRAIRQGVPHSTARGWLKSPRSEVITVDVVNMDVARLQREVLLLRQRVQRLLTALQLLFAQLKVVGFSFDHLRVPDGTNKSRLLREIERSRSVLSLRVVFRVIRLPHSQYYSWKRDQQCGLDNLSYCPRVSPQQLTTGEIETIKQMVTSDEYRHVPTGVLAIFAQRLKKVFASASIWYRLIRLHGWRRPRGVQVAITHA